MNDFNSCHALEVLRTKEEMKIYFEELYSKINNDEEVKKKARLNKGFFKKFYEEFYPLYCYSQSELCEKDCKLALVCGNQGYDALKINKKGETVFIEFTEFKFGQIEHEEAVLLNTTGKEHQYTPKIPKDKYIQGFINNAIKKSKKDYSDCIIIFILKKCNLVESLSEDTMDIAREIIKGISSLNLVAKQVLLLILEDEVQISNGNLILIVKKTTN